MATTKKEVTHKPRPSLIPKLTTTFKSDKSGKPGPDPARQGRNICFSDSSNKVKRDSQEQDEEVQKVKRYRQLTKEFTKYVSRFVLISQFIFLKVTCRKFICIMIFVKDTLYNAIIIIL